MEVYKNMCLRLKNTRYGVAKSKNIRNYFFLIVKNIKNKLKQSKKLIKKTDKIYFFVVFLLTGWGKKWYDYNTIMMKLWQNTAIMVFLKPIWTEEKSDRTKSW